MRSTINNPIIAKGKHMNHPVVVESLQLILAGDIAGAERALVAVADDEGDQALVAVLDQLPPKDLLAVMREFDSSKESIVNMVVTPEQFARAIVLEKKYDDRTGEKLRAMINAVIHRESQRVGEYLEEIANLEGGYETLADYFQDRFEEILHFATLGTFTREFDHEAFESIKSITLLAERLEEIDESLGFGDAIAGSKPKVTRAEIADGDWMETAWVLRYELEDEFEHMVMTLRSRWQRLIEMQLAASGEEVASPNPAHDAEESAI
jgi:hypothetical protein